MENVICRPATPGDIDDIMYLERESFNKFTRESKGVFSERIMCFSDGFMVLETKTVSGGNKVMGAISSEIWSRNGALLRVGFVLGHSIEKRMDLGGNELYISSFAVLPQFRVAGYGKVLFRGLLENIVKRYPLVRSVLVLVNDSWEYAKRFYTDYGFGSVAVFDGFFTEDDGVKSNGIVMRHGNIFELI